MEGSGEVAAIQTANETPFCVCMHACVCVHARARVCMSMMVQQQHVLAQRVGSLPLDAVLGRIEEVFRIEMSSQ